MESLRRADSNLSISSITFDSKDDDSETTVKTNAMLKVLLEAASETNAENSVLSCEILELLNILKVDLKTLPPDIRDGLQTVTAILKSEALPSVDETLLKLCLEKKKIQNIMKKRTERLLKAKNNPAFSMYICLEEKLNRLRKEIEQIEDLLQSKMSDIEDEESNRILWTSRLYDYKQTVKKLQEELDNLQYNEIGLEQTSNKASTLTQKINDLDDINNKLSKYSDLPPNLLQARNALESKKREQEAIKNLLYEKMND